MEHVDIVAYLDTWLDGGLHDDNQIQVFAHLAACRECRSYVEGVMVMRRAALSSTYAVPPSIDETVLAMINQSSASRVRSSWYERWRVPVPVAAAAVLLAIAISALSGQYLGAKWEATRWEREMGVHYQIPAMVVVGYTEKSEVIDVRTQ